MVIKPAIPNVLSIAEALKNQIDLFVNINYWKLKFEANRSDDFRLSCWNLFSNLFLAWILEIF